MQHVIKKLTIFSLLLFTLANISQAHAYGAKMYCVSASNSNNWDWAHWKFKSKETGQQIDITDSVQYYSSTIQNNGDNRVYLEGGLAYVNNSPTLAVMGYEYDAICAKLAKICTDEYGPDYKYIGAGGGPAVSGWNGVSIYSNGSFKSSGHTCPNWWTK
jgi:hypothetical protein